MRPETSSFILSVIGCDAMRNRPVSGGDAISAVRRRRCVALAMLAVSLLMACSIGGMLVTSEDASGSTCSTCNGTGKVTCPTCGGEGTYTYRNEDYGCEACGGGGSVAEGDMKAGSGYVECSACNGTGSISDEQKVTSISISGSSSVKQNSSVTLSATVLPSNATDSSVTWSIDSGNSYVTISPNGKSCTVTGKAVGTATIKATANDGSGKYGTMQVKVTSAAVLVTSIDVSGTTSFTLGSSASLTVSVTPSNAANRDVTFERISGDDIGAGFVYSSGKLTLTATKAGTATIRATASDGSGIYKDFTVTVTEPAKQTYYAHLYYNASGGSGAPSEQSDSIYAATASGSATFTIPASSVTKTGYEFKGWSATSGSSTVEYRAGDRISVPYNESKTLYAVWEQVQYTSTLRFDANGGSNAPEAQQFIGTSTASHTFTIPSNIPTKSGSEFKGWAESSLADKASYQPGSTISVPYDGTKTLYAVWGTPQLTISSEPVKTVKVGQAWSYTPAVNVEGCTVTVTGADWLSVSSGTISGTPAKVGSHEVIVKVSKTGYSDAVQTFTLKVCSQYDSAPSAQGIFAYAE